MIRHIAMFRWSPGATSEQLDAVSAGLAHLEATIAEIRSYAYGPDLGLNEGNHDFAVVADFDDADAYLVYRDHPAHQAFIAGCIAPIRAERASVQLSW